MTNPGVYHSPYPLPHMPTDCSISQFLVRGNPDDVQNDKVILQGFENQDEFLTYGGLRDAAGRHSAALQHTLLLKPGDVVSICAYNSVNWAIFAHSVLWGGGSISAMNPLATSYELVHYLSIALPRVIAVDEDLLPKIRSALKDMKLSQEPIIVVLGKSRAEADSSLLRFPEGFEGRDLAPLPPFDLSAHDNRKVPAAMVFSSGTSGKPKGVVLSHHNLIAQLLTVRATNPFVHNGHMREVFYPSFAHIYGIVSGLLLPAWVGCYVMVMKQYDFIPYVKQCSDIRATVLRLVPATAIRLVKDPEVRHLSLVSVKTVMCAGAALALETVKELQNILDPEAAVLNGYGMSETTIMLQRETRPDKPGSVGKPAAGVSVRIVDDEGRDVLPGQDGECLVQGPTVFMHYKSNPVETREAFVGPWLRTGDILRVDEDGFWWLTGRKKELIKYKGNQVAPAELESVLLGHPLVSDAGVCGIYDKKAETEIPAGCVVLAREMDEISQRRVIESIRNYVDERVSPYKKLRGGLYAVKELPKGSTGKLLRRELPARIEEYKRLSSKL